MIKLTDVKGKAWWVNPSAVAAVTACDDYGKEWIHKKYIKTRTYIYVGGFEHVIHMAEPPEKVVRMLGIDGKVRVSADQWDMFSMDRESADADTVTMPPGGRRHQ